jgi:RIO kinase 1
VVGKDGYLMTKDGYYIGDSGDSDLEEKAKTTNKQRRAKRQERFKR